MIAKLTQPTNRLRVLRAEHRLTQWDTARAAQINNSRYWLIESGRTQPRPEERERLAAVFGVPVSRVFPRQPKGAAA